MQNKALGGKKKISALHCEFMRQALGSSAVQSAVLITSDVSHCLGLTCLEESRKRLAALAGWAPTRMGGFGAVYHRGNAAQTALWYIAVRSRSQNLHRTLTQPLQFLNTHNLSRSWRSFWPDFPCPSILFKTETDHATSLLC